MGAGANRYSMQKAYDFSDKLQSSRGRRDDGRRPAIDCNRSKSVQFRAIGYVVDDRQHLTLRLNAREERAESTRRR